ncbi:DUF885 domain-containing protein [Nocardioides mangrovicus]|uniref:DUF885 domain-containing protein n=1 Tax=Nocardioides mangrovicus TaxID=2478913 RepID=A0A3L8NWJ8_9ACTN|nr:DUF885 domain-containing protein [Nocardioides mangrovicus]RLV47520.1 DUF885 domain-containing protein [Nocardioides mangrovicus]
MSDIDDLAREYWDATLQAEPTEAHLLGLYPQGEGRFEDLSRAEEDRRIAQLRDFADRAEALSGLDEEQQVTAAVLVSDARTSADLLETRLAELSADPIFGMQTSMPLVLGMLTLPDARVAEAMVGTFEGIGAAYDALADRVREGVEHGRRPAQFAVRETVRQLDEALDVAVADDPMVAALALPEGSEDLRSRLVDVVSSSVRPGMERYRDVLRDVVLAQARPDEQCGLSWLDDGAETYAAALRYFTTTDKTAQEIHDIGLAQVEALAQEYRELGAEALGTDDLAEIFERMRTDPELHFETGDQLVEASKQALERAGAEMGDWFETLPKAPCAVEGTLTGAKAFYFPPATDGSRGGTFFVNVDEPQDWGTFELESMAFHEGIPGHHLQLSVAGELPDSVPEFRKHLHTAAYTEGWGLYSERLSDEMGLYGSQVDRLGMLSADSLRACRLVVDTGLHALGWSRQQAVDYMVANSPMTEGIVRPEVDRYVVSPGQACSYMVGRLEIQRMRREAEQRRGDDFEIKAFHTAVLDQGPLPLDVLDRVVRARLS